MKSPIGIALQFSYCHVSSFTFFNKRSLKFKIKETRKKKEEKERL